MNVHDWKNDEYGYCVALVRTQGNRNVPRGAVQSYMELQRACAERDGRHDVADRLDHLLAEWAPK